MEELTNFADRAIDAHFEDPTLSFVSGKQNLHTGLSAIQGATSRMEKKRYEKNALNAADVHVGAKVIKRTKFDPTIEESVWIKIFSIVLVSNSCCTVFW